MDKIGVYVRSEEKIYIMFGDEIFYFEGHPLEEIMENFVEEHNISRRSIVEIILHFSYFNINEKIKEIKEILKKLNLKFGKHNIDKFCIFNLYKDKNIEIFQIGETESISFEINNKKIGKIENHNFNIEDFIRESNYDFGDMEVISLDEKCVRDIFNGFKIKNNKISKIDIYIVLILVIFPFLMNIFLNISQDEDRIEAYRKELKTKEEELKNFESDNFDDYLEDLKILEEIDNELKRRDYYSIILELLKLSFNEIDYRKITFENGEWKIEGSTNIYEKVAQFEKKLKKKYKNTRLGYIKDDNDNKVLFEYIISEN